MMLLLELDPNVVKPGWIPLLITIGLALVMVLLFRSMRRHFRRVSEFYPETPATLEAPDEVATDAPADRPAASTTTQGTTAPDDERSPSR